MAGETLAGAELKTKLEDMLRFFETNRKSAGSVEERAKIDGIIRALKDALGADLKNAERAHAYFSGLGQGYQKIAALLREYIEDRKKPAGSLVQEKVVK
ncbi:MAG: hypothetical protein AB1468_03425 [Candidatus Micrarchaeota archaeon]